MSLDPTFACPCCENKNEHVAPKNGKIGQHWIIIPIHVYDQCPASGRTVEEAIALAPVFQALYE